MIEKMKMVHIVSSVSKKTEMLDALRDLGIMHLAEKKSGSREIADKFALLSKTDTALKEYLGDAKPETAVLSDKEFEAMYSRALETLDRKADLTQKIAAVKAELERIQEWGDFSPAELAELKKAGYNFHFYRMGKAEYKAAAEDETVKMIRLRSVDKMETVAVMGTLPVTIMASEFTLPEKSVSELKGDLKAYEADVDACNAILKASSVYGASFKAQMLKTQNEEEFSSAKATAESDSDLVWISGYVPEVEMARFKETAAAQKWAWAEDDVAEDDEKIPTKVRYNKVSALIEPLFNILGVLPGYREQDISIWFLMFFTLFFAMIIGDGGYGAIILVGAIVMTVKSKKLNDTLFLLYVLSIATIIWGAVTGTWFGMESAMKVPFLKALVIPNFANYPEYFNVSATAQQNTIMKFSFLIGAIQMCLGSLLSVKNKIPKKDLSFVADLAWVMSIICMYLMTLFLVIKETINIMPVFVCIGIGFVLVIMFGGMSPDKTFAQGLKSGLADAFTQFLNTISCFGNVMSYIRLFAVGMAGLAISQSFNGIAAGFKGPLVIAGVVVVIIGHLLNLIMAFLSVVVHGVRLNVLEFSGQAGLEWTGIPYEPFKENEKIKN